MADTSHSNNIGISHLPNEVLSQILSYSPKLWLKDLRLVNRVFATLGARYLFDTAAFSPCYMDISDYLNIANHPIFCHYVKTVVYCGIRVEDVTTFHEYKKLKSQKTYGTMPTKDALVAGYTKTRIMQEEQQQLLKSGEALALMSVGLTKFSSLYHIEIADLRSGETLPGESRTILGPGRLSRDMGNDRFEPNVLLTRGNPSSHHTHHKQVFPLFALSLSQRSVQEITSYGDPWWSLNADSLDALHDNSLRIYPLLGHLRVLRVDFSCLFAMGSWTKARELIGAARAIKELLLEVDGWGTEFFPFHTLVRKNTWSRLRSLLISHAKVSETVLVTTLASYAPTLRRFEMFLTCLTEGRWVTVVTHMREALSLQQCHLFVKLDDDGGIIDRLLRVDADEKEFDLGGYVLQGGEIPSKLVGIDMHREQQR